MIDHYDYKRSKVYHAAVDFGDVVVKSINTDRLRVGEVQDLVKFLESGNSQN